MEKSPVSPLDTSSMHHSAHLIYLISPDRVGTVKENEFDIFLWSHAYINYNRETF